MAPKTSRAELLSLLGRSEGAAQQVKDRAAAIRCLKEMSLPETEQNISNYIELKKCTKRVGRRMLLDAQDMTLWGGSLESEAGDGNLQSLGLVASAPRFSAVIAWRLLCPPTSKISMSAACLTCSQEKDSYNRYESSLHSVFWALPHTDASLDQIAKAGVRPEQVIDASKIQLPRGIDSKDLILLDQSVPRALLGVGVGVGGTKEERECSQRVVRERKQAKILGSVGLVVQFLLKK